MSESAQIAIAYLLGILFLIVTANSCPPAAPPPVPPPDVRCPR